MEINFNMIYVNAKFFIFVGKLYSMSIKIKQISSLVCTFFFAILIYGQEPTGYYNNAQGLSGAELKTALYTIIKGHTSRTYTNLWTDFQSTDKKANGKVWDMYSDVPGGTPAYEWTFISQQCGNYKVEGDCYNREHSFPKSWFNDASPMVTDLFHIYPTDGYVNGKRGNYPYGEVTNPGWTSTNGSKLGANSTPGYSGTVFEPIDEYKGDFARTYFYMATRYEDVITNWNSVVLDGTKFPVYVNWTLDLLIRWHEEDSVSQKEEDRNNAVYSIQHNRNPFIDHPEYVAAVWGTALGTENIPSQRITVFPNPAKDWIQLSGLSSDNYKILIFNYLGQIEYKEDANMKSNYKLNLEHLRAGIYIIQIRNTDTKVQNLRLIIQ